MVLLFLIPKIIVLSTFARPAHRKVNETKIYTDNSNNKDNNKINEKITNFSFNIKKRSSRISFFIFKTILAFIWLIEIFIKAFILYYFDWKYHIQIKINISSDIIDKVLNQLTFETSLATWMTYKSNNHILIYDLKLVNNIK